MYEVSDRQEGEIERNKDEIQHAVVQKLRWEDGPHEEVVPHEGDHNKQTQRREALPADEVECGAREGVT